MADATIEYLLRIRDEASQALKDLGEEAGEAESKLKGADKGTQSMTASMIKAQAAIGSLKVAFNALKGAFDEVITGSIKVGAQMESFETKLTTLLGSSEAASDRISQLFEIGSTTPFALDQLVAAEVKLEAFGVTGDRARTAVMDLAAFMDGDLIGAADAVGRAFQGGAGAADILRDRGVLAMVELQAGIKPTELTLEQFRETLIDTLTDPQGKIAGGTEKLAATFDGLMSNLGDAWFGFQKQIADSDLFETSKETLKLTLGLLEDNAEVTRQWAQILGTGVTASFLLIAEMLAKIGQGALLLFSSFQQIVVWAVKINEVTGMKDLGLGRGLPSLAAAEEALQLTIDTAAALSTFDKEVDKLQDSIRGLSNVKIGPSGGGAGGAGAPDFTTEVSLDEGLDGALKVDTVTLETQAFRGGAQPEGTLAQFQQTQFVAALGEALSGLGGVLSNALSSARSLAGGSLPGMTWWGQAINLLAEFADPIDWGKLEQTIHDAFVGAVRLFFDLDAIFGAIVDGVVFGIQDAFSRAREGGAEPTGGEAISGLISRINETLGTEAERSFQIGTKFVDQTGLALLHRGEQVVPANGAMPSNMQGFGGGGGLVVNVNAPLGIGPGTAEQLVRELNSILGARGLNLAVT